METIKDWQKTEKAKKSTETGGRLLKNPTSLTGNTAKDERMEK